MEKGLEQMKDDDSEEFIEEVLKTELGDSLEKELSLDEQMHNFNMKHFPNGNKEISSDGFPTIFKICRKKIDYFQGDRNNINNLYDWATHNC